MLKIPQLRLKQSVNCELPDVQAGFRKGRGTKINLPTSTESLKKQQNSRKTSTSALLTTLKPLTMWSTANCGKFLKRWEYQITLPVSWETCTWLKKKQNRTWNNRLVQNWERRTSRLYIVTLLFNFYAEYIMWNARLDEAQYGIKIARRNINNLRYADDTT